MFEYNFLRVCFISINRLKRSYLFHILQNMCEIHKLEETLDLVIVEVWIDNEQIRQWKILQNYDKLES